LAVTLVTLVTLPIVARAGNLTVEDDEAAVEVGAGVRVDSEGVEIGGIRIDGGGIAIGEGKGRRTFSVNGNDQKVKHDCEGGDAAVNGNDNDLTFRNCAAVTVRGNDNRVDAGTPSAVSVLGSDNSVSWREAEEGTKVTNLGSDNRLDRK
jgi:hypothetical protein